MKYPSFKIDLKELNSSPRLDKLQFIHIGFNKTATTWMEKCFYPHNLGLECVQGGYYQDLNQAVDYIVFERESQFDVTIARKLIYNAFIKNFGKVPNVFMHESFTFRYFIYFDQKRVVERLSKVFENCIFVMGFRDRKGWIISHYNQYIRAGGTKGFDEFFEVLVERKNSDLYMCFFGELISYCYEIFGEDKFIIYNIEETKNLEIMSKKFGIKLVTEEFSKFNVSESPGTLMFMRFLNMIVRHDCGASPYQKSETDLAYESKYKEILSKIRYKYKYLKIPMAKVMGKTSLGLVGKIKLNKKQLKSIEEIFFEDELIIEHLNKSNKQHLSSNAPNRARFPGLAQLRRLDK